MRDSSPPIDEPWSRLGALLLVCTLVAALYWASVAPLLSAWLDWDRGTYTHGLLLVAVAVGFLVAKRQEFAASPWRPCGPAVAVLLCLTVLWLVFLRAGIQTAHELLLPAILWTTILAIFGPPIARLCVFPCALLLFTIPVWDALNGTLQWATVQVAGQSLQWAGVPAHIEGDFVQIPVATFEIEGGCSGLHFLVVALVIGALYGEICGQPLRARAALLGLAAALGVLSNWIRVFFIILAGQLTAMHSYLVTVDHVLFGWCVFAAALVLFFVIARRMTLPESNASGFAVPTIDRRRAAVVATAALGALSVCPAWAAVRGWQPPPAAAVVMLRPARDWIGPMPSQGGWQPVYPGADAQQLAVYRNDHTALQVYVAAYATQAHAKKFIGYGVAVLGAVDVVTVERPLVAAGRPVLETQLLDSHNDGELLWSWYVVGGRHFRSGARAQLWYGLTSVFASPQSRVVVLRAHCAADCSSERREMEKFVGESDWLSGVKDHG